MRSNKDKRVLSIDIDFLFKDCVKYQKYQHEDLSPEQSWEIVRWKYKKDFEFDKISYMWLLDVLKKTCSNAIEFRLIEEHDEIVDCFEDWDLDIADCVNVDNHHDITYGNCDDELNLENWVKVARDRELIYQYHWIHTDNSELCSISPIHYTHASWKDSAVDKLGNFDYVVICLSKYFTPIEYWWLQDALADTLYGMGIQGDKYINTTFVNKDKDAFLLERDWYNKDKRVEKERYNKNFVGYTLGYDLMSDGNVWMSMIRNEGEEFNGFKFISDIMNFLHKLLNEKNTLVFGYKKGYKSEVIIERLVGTLCKEYEIKSIITNKNKYYIIESKK